MDVEAYYNDGLGAWLLRTEGYRFGHESFELRLFCVGPWALQLLCQEANAAMLPKFRHQGPKPPETLSNAIYTLKAA